MPTKSKPIDSVLLQKAFCIIDGQLCRKLSPGQYKLFMYKQRSRYIQVSFLGLPYSYHRIIWVLSTGKDIPCGFEIDHKNGDKKDNRFENLRLVTHKINLSNRKEHRNGGFIGCSFRKDSKRWQSRIWDGNRNIYLGTYQTKDEAHKAYTIAEKSLLLSGRTGKEGEPRKDPGKLQPQNRKLHL